jgi:hypothetical protein
VEEPEAGTLEGANAAVAPARSPETVRATSPSKAFCPAIERLYAASAPCIAVTEGGATVRAKSAAGAADGGVVPCEPPGGGVVGGVVGVVVDERPAPGPEPDGGAVEAAAAVVSARSTLVRP